MVRRAAAEAGRRLAERERLAAADEVAWLDVDEVRAALRETPGGGPADLRALVRRRRAEHAWVAAHPGEPFVGGEPGAFPDLRHLPAEGRRVNQAFLFMMGQEYGRPPEPSDGRTLTGLGASAGTYRGRVRVVRSDADFPRLQPGDVLVCPVTTPTWSPLFAVAGALVTDNGGVLSHAAIVARENGLPAVVGTVTATAVLRDGAEVVVDGSRGTVTKLP